MVSLRTVAQAVAQAIQLIDTAPGASYPNSRILTATNANQPQSFPIGRVKRMVIRNLSSSDTIQIFNTQTPGSGAFVGLPLNPAPGVAEGGDSLATGNIDVTDLRWIAPTAGDQIAVYWET